MTESTFRRICWQCVLMIPIAVIATFASYAFFSFYRELQEVKPIVVQTIDEIHLDNPDNEVRAGEYLQIRFTVTRRMECRNLIHWSMTNDDTGVQMDAGIVPSYINQIGEKQRGSVQRMIPAWFPPGNYTYQSINYNTNCTNGRSYTTAPPALHFTVVK
jgi:hypothetical protein